MLNSKPLIVNHADGYRAQISEISHCQFTIRYFDPENGDLGSEEKGASSAEALAEGSVKDTLTQLAKNKTRSRG